MKKYSPALIKKKEHVFLSKSDLVSKKELKEKRALLKKIHKTITVISVYDWDSLQKVQKILNVLKDKKCAPQK